MNSSHTTNLLRNSYGYQKNQTPFLKSPTNRGFPIQNQKQGAQTNNEPQLNTLRQQESKIENFQALMKKKQTPEVQNPPVNQNAALKTEGAEYKSRPHFPMPGQEERFNQPMLRGSCQDVLKNFDYGNLRKTTHFNPTEKRSTQQEIRRSPKQELKHMHMSKASTFDTRPTFLKAEGRTQECHGSFVSPSKTPPKTSQYGHKTGRTPIKYKTYTEVTKTSGMSRGSPEDQKVKPYTKTLNELMELKNKQKNASNAKNLKKSPLVNGFQFGKSLGKGKFGEVFLCRHQDSGLIAAIKRIQKKKVVQYKMVDQFTKQIRLHASLDHPNIVKFFGVFEDRDFIYLVMQYMNGGTLFDYLNEVPYLDVQTASLYLKDVIDALTYMHDKSIAHRDIKPQNIVTNSEGVAKLCDFGWSALIETSRQTYCGTFDYAPPQILERKNYDASVDIWCIGVLTYELLTGKVPFQGDKKKEIMQKIVNVDKNKIDYPINIPAEAKQFIETLVQKDPSLRPRSQDLLKYRFFTQNLPKNSKAKKMQ